ncbi:LANO_0G02388g1_1 [Lachancea nothofagi CBS 11611]|uniref:LANO_0G02388g1_1 n=1 Tax=Lachancea nothofagi CBS 11611 TaxID=1266666 RepID=A0A1G4KF06_9SACH|nr:LANO_0G02388g1_1 [Lachancea nothofagi CBS 11611]
MGELSSKKKRICKFLKQQFPCSRILAQRIFKSTVHATVALIFCLIPKVRDRLGNQPSMLPLIAVMVHPGRRVSATIQGAIYCITGLLFGLAYSLLGRFIAQRCLGHTWHVVGELQQYAENYTRYESALAILAVFETIMLFVHGWMRSVSHHYFHIVFPLFLVVHFAFMAPLTQDAGTIAKAFSVPFYLGIAMSIFWNLVLFPEFGSTYLGNSTVDALNEIHNAIDSAINFFISIDVKDPTTSLYTQEPVSLARLLKTKNTIEGKVSSCNLVLEECMYEISYSFVSPSDLKSVIQSFNHLSMYINALVNACQLEFLLIGRQDKYTLDNDLMNIETEKEIRHADARKLLKVLGLMRDPIFNLHKTLSESLFMIKAALAYVYDVKLDKVQHSILFRENATKFQSSKDPFKDLEFDKIIDNLVNGVIDFDLRAREELIHLDENLLQPNDEMFLFSSFLLNFKETTNSVVNIMKETRKIYQYRKRQELKGSLRGKTLWVNFLSNYNTFKTWITGASKARITESQSLNGGTIGDNYRPPADMGVKRPQEEEREILSQRRSDVVTFMKTSKLLPTTNASDSSTGKKSNTSHTSVISDSSNVIVKSIFSKSLVFSHDFYHKHREHFRFGLQVTIALMLASFPMFIPKARDWYIKIRGTWIGFVCILALEPSVGGTFWVFFLRGVGVILGAAWAYVSYLAGCNQTNPYLEVVVTIFGAVPGFYYLLGTPYVKAAIIQIISIYVVMLAAILPSDNQGSILSNFAKRCLAVGYGGGIAVLVQVTMFPVTARDQLNGEISFVAGCISEMQMLLAAGLEGESLNSSVTDERYQRFAKISASAKSALSRASAYKGLTRQEPRLKGEYTELEKVFTQMIYIQRQILDRMDNMILLRKQYGSAIIEELNYMVYGYRRQYVASITSLMRAVQEAIRNKTPLPQFLPSARIAHRRLVNKVQSILKIKYASKMKSLRPRVMVDLFGNKDDSSDDDEGLTIENQHQARSTLPPHEYIMKEKFLSWNASSAAAEEIIEYVEELVQLSKILVGVNEFKYGFLSRPLYADWAAEAAVRFDDFVKKPHIPLKAKTNSRAGYSKRSNGLPSTPTISEEDLQDDLSIEENGPVALDALSSSDTEESRTLDLARIASRKSEVASLPKKLRKRAFSIGSKGDAQGTHTSLSKLKTLGSGELIPDEHSDSDTDEELPLALKKMIFK